MIIQAWLLVLSAFDVFIDITRGTPVEDDPSIKTTSIRMPNVPLTQEFSWFCHAKRIESTEPLYVVGVDLVANFNSPLHHISIFACTEPVHHEPHWECYGDDVCRDKSVTIWGWSAYGVDVEKWRFPDDVGIGISGRTPLRYLVIQVHYSGRLPNGQTDDSGMLAYLSSKPRSYSAGYFLTAVSGYVPPKQTDFHADCSCVWPHDETIEVIGYSVHSHKPDRATFLEGYHVRNDNWTPIGLMLPSVQANLKPLTPHIRFQKGDYLVSRCHIKNEGDEQINFGTSNNDEMCNFEVMFKYKVESGRTEPLRMEYCGKTMPDYHLEEDYSNVPKSPKHPIIKGLINV